MSHGPNHTRESELDFDIRVDNWLCGTIASLVSDGDPDADEVTMMVMDLALGTLGDALASKFRNPSGISGDMGVFDTLRTIVMTSVDLGSRLGKAPEQLFLSALRELAEGSPEAEPVLGPERGRVLELGGTVIPALIRLEIDARERATTGERCL